ncbi:MAG: glycosyltransferase family 2 protein [Ginsengibacter sp.]
MYGLLLSIIIFIRKKFISTELPRTSDNFPDLTLIVAIYNEAQILEKKINNTLSLKYPENKFDILFVTDGSTDGSNEIIKKYPRIRLVFKNERKGKVAAINHAMNSVRSELVVFCDANTFLNSDCLLNLARHYINPKVGAVAGEKKVIDSSELQDVAGAGEGLYWKYESLLKKLDSKFYTVVGAAGELFSMRTKLYKPVEEFVLLDDFIISLRICQMGFRVLYEPNATAIETSSASLAEEKKRKIRIGAGGFQSIWMLRDLLNIFKYGKLSFQFISHRVLRWAVCPFMLPIIFLSNLFICLFQESSLYVFLFAIQVLFYVAALAGYILSVKQSKVTIFYVPFYFVFMNICIYLGLIRFLGGKQSVLWDKAVRKPEILTI